MRLIRTYLLAVANVLATLFICTRIAFEVFDVPMMVSSFFGDFLLSSAMALLLVWMLRSGTVAHLLITSLVAVSVLAGAAKISLLGAPPEIQDFSLIRQLFEILESWRYYAIIVLLIFFFSLLIYFLDWRKAMKFTVISFFIYCAYIIFPVYEYTSKLADRVYGGVAWDSEYNYKKRGALVYLMTRRYGAANSGSIEYDNAYLADVSSSMDVNPEFDFKKNVYLIMVEALFDPVKLKADGLFDDPIDPYFRRLMAASDSQVLVPTFGGKTSNSEFEALCGLPADNLGVDFMSMTDRPMPCLPNALRALGYKTIASHPYKKSFWNRDIVYQAVGFDVYNTLESFRAEDINYGMFVSDESLFGDIYRSHQEGKSGIFHYVVTISSHYPFGLNAQRPKKIRTNVENESFNNYINSIHYTTKELGDFVRKLRLRDPDALIVIFGDHLPAIEGGKAFYSEAGFFPSDRFFYEHKHYKNKYATPLVVVNGQEGSVKLGDVPLWRLPGEILKMAGYEGDMLPSQVIDFRSQNSFRGVESVVMAENKVCKGVDDEPDFCRDAFSDQHKFLMLKNDLLYGEQLSVPSWLHESEAAAASYEIDPNPMTECNYSIENFGPRLFSQGTRFNLQPSGKSALWFSGVKSSRPLVVSVDGQKFEMAYSGSRMSASQMNPKFLRAAGTYSIDVGCSDGELQSLGKLEVR